MNVVQQGGRARIVIVGFDASKQGEILEHLTKKFDCKGGAYTNLFRETNIYLVLRPYQQQEVCDEIVAAGFAEKVWYPVTFPKPEEQPSKTN